MKPLLALILVITTLASTAAWAWDSHARTLIGQGVIALNANSDGANPADHGIECMDPCSHGTAHLLALSTSPSGMTAPSTSPYVMTNDPHWFSFAPLPLHKPPRT